jgi:hypothetical protein
MSPQRSPRRCRRIHQIIGPDTARSVCEVRLNFREGRAQERGPLRGTLLCLFVVIHRAVLVECAEADLRMDLKCPTLGFRRARVIDLLNLRCDTHACWLRPLPLSLRFVALPSA